MTALAQTLRDVCAAANSVSDGSKAVYTFNKFKEDCLQRARRGHTSNELTVDWTDLSKDERESLGADLVAMINREELKVLEYDDSSIRYLTVTVSWR
jgi:hypothetical protein